MKKRELAKKGLVLALTAAMCAQPLMVSSEEFSFQSEMDGITWRLDVNGVLYLEVKGNCRTKIMCIAIQKMRM